MLRLEPLRNFTVVKDLAVEMTEFFDKWRDAKGHFEPAKPRADFAGRAAGLARAPGRRRRHRMHRLRRLLFGLRRRDLEQGLSGPAALNRAWTLVNDVRDAGNDARIDAVSAAPAATPATAT